MKVRHLVFLSCGLLFAGYALADGEALAKKNGCMTCHAANKKVVGPSFKEVAAKYKGDPEAATKLAQKVRNGGAGSFGSTPMLPAPKSVSDDDIKTIVAWILTQ